MFCENCSHTVACTLNGICVLKANHVADSVMIDDEQEEFPTVGNEIPTLTPTLKETPMTTKNSPFATFFTKATVTPASTQSTTQETPAMNTEMTLSEKVDALMLALTHGSKVKFTYTKFGATESRTHYVIPSHVWAYADGKVKFKGINYAKGYEFVVSRMTDIVVLEPMKSTKKYYYPGTWDLVCYCRSALEGKNVADYLARGWSDTPVVIYQPVAA